MALLESIFLISLVLFCFYKWSTSTYDFFEKRNIPFAKPFPLLGNFKGQFLKTESIFEAIRRYHLSFSSQVYGVFDLRQPIIVLKNVELIKQITVKDFDYFINHRTIVDEDADILFGSTLLCMKDQKWKDMRSTLSPAFTSSKMRLMFQLINECCNEALKYLKEKSELSESKEVELELKDYFTRFTNDVIASTAFGLKVNSMTDQDNEFFNMGKKITNFSLWFMIKFSLFNICKPLMKLFKVNLFDEQCTRYFIKLVMDAMKYRSAHEILRPDMIHMLMEAQKSTKVSHKQKWTNEEIVAQCFVFFLAGFDTTALLMCFAAHELMENPEIQEKLLVEIDAVKKNMNGNPLTYEALQGMKYLDMVASETLRKWPGIVATDRVCVKPYLLKTDELCLEIKPGDILWIPITGLHYDPEHFPNPHKFDPERFSDKNKRNINPFAYVPFGMGPRNCIGSRLALMEAKAILYNILCHFTFEASPKTKIPLEIEKLGFSLKPKDGFWLKLSPRN